jgi:tetratricopeptide (TPR) repeat protein
MKTLKSCAFLTLLTVFLYSNLPAQDVQPLMSKGDSSYHAYNNEAALEYYTKVLEIDENNYDASWKLARAYVDVGETKQDKKERKAFYKKGEEFARKAVEIDSNGAKGHLFLSVAIGRVALDAGKKEQVRLSKEVKSEVDKALALDPNDDIAWHVLGRWHRKMATLSWIQRNFANIFLGGVPKEASVEKSSECFQKAIEISPNHINHYLELGLTYEELKEREKAIAQYETVLALPKADADDDKYKEEAQERLSKLKK